MKKLFFSTLLLLGMLSISQAQPFQLDYYIQNASITSTWEFGIAEAGGLDVSGSISPGNNAMGTVTFSGAFPIEWKVGNNLGCQYYNLETGPVTETSIPFSCTPTNPSGVYKIELIGVNHYIFKMELN